MIKSEFIYENNNEDLSLLGLNGAAELIGRGWDKEAIPVIQTKKSVISTFFHRLFS